MPLTVADLPRLRAAIVAEEARRSGSRSFSAFVKQAWPIFETVPLVWSWAMEAVCAHLEAVIDERMRRLLITMPPRSGKSNLFSVLLPAWTWITRPTEQFLFMSHSIGLAVEHSVKCRIVIESDWYRKSFGIRWQLRDDQNVKHDFVNTFGGRRMSFGVDSKIIGRGATILCIDDPLEASEAHKPAAREAAQRAVTSAYSRLNDKRTGRIVMAMQRVHAEDPAKGAIDAGYEHCCMPAEFDPGRRAVTHHIVTRKNGHVERVREEFWRDPRTDPGELLFPERLNAEVLREAKLQGAAAYAAQYQQQPIAHADAGGYFRRGSVKHWHDVMPADVVARVRRWDLASVEGGGDWTVGVKLARLRDGTFVVEDVRRVQMGPRGVRGLVKATAELDGSDCQIVIVQDPGQAGKDQAQEYVLMLAGYTVHVVRETGDKVTRAGAASAQWEAGNIAVVKAPWNAPFFESLEGFPDQAVHDDDVDALSGAVTHLSLKPRGVLDALLDVSL